MTDALPPPRRAASTPDWEDSEAGEATAPTLPPTQTSASTAMTNPSPNLNNADKTLRSREAELRGLVHAAGLCGLAAAVAGSVALVHPSWLVVREEVNGLTQCWIGDGLLARGRRFGHICDWRGAAPEPRTDSFCNPDDVNDSYARSVCRWTRPASWMALLAATCALLAVVVCVISSFRQSRLTALPSPN